VATLLEWLLPGGEEAKRSEAEALCRDLRDDQVPMVNVPINDPSG